MNTPSHTEIFKVIIGESEDILKFHSHSYLGLAPGGARIPDTHGFRNCFDRFDVVCRVKWSGSTGS